MSPDPRDLLSENLGATVKVSARLKISLERVATMFPLDEEGLASLDDDEEEHMDAFLLRFGNLVSMVQDHVARSLLLVEEESLADTTRKDQRLLLEKIGALDPATKFGEIASLRYRLSYSYPDDSAKQCEILNKVYQSAKVLQGIVERLKVYASEKLNVTPAEILPVTTKPKTP